MSLTGTATGVGPYEVPNLASVSGTLPAWLLAPEAASNCLARLEQNGGSVEIRQMCYRGVQIDPDGSVPAPPPYRVANHDLLTGQLNQATGDMAVAVLDCVSFLGLFAVDMALTFQLDKAGGPASGAVTVVEDTTAPFDCADGAQTTGSLTLTPLPDGHDEDQDGCPDWEELGEGESQGGLRDPFNPWDYFNPVGDGQNRIDDILAVVQQFAVDSLDPEYSQDTDRTSLGPKDWDLGPPDGHQRVDDILHAVKQFGHDCA